MKSFRVYARRYAVRKEAELTCALLQVSRVTVLACTLGSGRAGRLCGRTWRGGIEEEDDEKDKAKYASSLSREKPPAACSVLNSHTWRPGTFSDRSKKGRAWAQTRHEEARGGEEERRGRRNATKGRHNRCGDPKEREEVTPRDCLNVKASCKARRCRYSEEKKGGGGRLKPGFRDKFPRFVHVKEHRDQHQKDISMCLGLEIVVGEVKGTGVACLEQEMSRVWAEKNIPSLKEGERLLDTHVPRTLRSHKKRPRHKGISC